ncbi:ABC transporter permease [Paenibacillus sp. KQZ6P-2]|uniref:ABC transporter permease n=1 Tax=Paenibacillus mangrovi TaxID=2931978 RepID=A0A9X1WK99_9BACL|nr:ABC transporter permease [Paenibacillus mangrovi]MCJ8010867.1 ABC transporter permease [Paenibacillus mangrovi]
MKKKALWSDIFREIWRTKARFLSIFAIIMLGVGFFAGIKATGPDMLDTADHYFKDQNLMDIKVQSTYGLNERDIAMLKQVPDVLNVQPAYSGDTFLGDSGLIAKVFSYHAEDPLNHYVVVEGRMPEKSGEIAIDASERGSRFKVGDTITFTNPDAKTDLEDTFRTLEYKVVGIVKSPQFISSMGRGASSIGKGTADVFAVIPDQDFKLSVYTEAYMSFKDTAELAPYTAAYDAKIDEHTKAVEQALASRPEERLAEVRVEGQAKLDEAQQKIDDANQKLADANQKLTDARQKLDQGERGYKAGVDKLQSETAKGQAKLDAAARDIAKGKAEIQRNQQTLADGQDQLQAGQAQLDEQKKTLEPKLAQGHELVKSLLQVSTMQPAAIPEAQQSQLQAAAQSADPELGKAVAGFMQGAVDGETLQHAATSFEQGLNQASQQLTNAQQELDAKKKQLEAGTQQLKAAEKKLMQGEAEWARNSRFGSCQAGRRSTVSQGENRACAGTSRV